ncbi:hypothetical protein BJY52DRAFT_1228294 [Lactarius psammicola]|nr:hypothetical protein BJY52DRAFT_1228294 [Lactarius psammicola]
MHYSKLAVRKERRAFKCLSQLLHDPVLISSDPPTSLVPLINTSGPYYYDMVYIHMDLNTRYAFAHEKALKNKCGYTEVSPYWELDAAGKADYSGPDGNFRKLHLSYPYPHIMRRNFTLRPFYIPFVMFTDPMLDNATFPALAIEKILEIADYKGFQKSHHSDMPGSTQSRTLNRWRLVLNGLLMLMVDKLWYDWQHRNQMNAKTFLGGFVQAFQNLDSYNKYINGSAVPADGLFPEFAMGDTMDPSSGILCYVYEQGMIHSRLSPNAKRNSESPKFPLPATCSIARDALTSSGPVGTDVQWFTFKLHFEYIFWITSALIAKLELAELLLARDCLSPRDNHHTVIPVAIAAGYSGLVSLVFSSYLALELNNRIPLLEARESATK